MQKTSGGDNRIRGVLLRFGSGVMMGTPFSVVLSAMEEMKEQVRGMMLPSAGPYRRLREETYLCFPLKIARAKR